ncbi:hypothetical protein E2C01_010456 [Portunus trituberculatus]|uniref:Ubiquitin-like domain-containing protein n=1 Tax=Portunus trituberculatus TaxID=210409 RepID=A0A5B7D8P3_PORTR|nr:hypothetical protein [Portunus trituberculatus]
MERGEKEDKKEKKEKKVRKSQCRSLAAVFAGIPAKDMFVIFNAQQLSDDKKTLKDYGSSDFLV